MHKGHPFVCRNSDRASSHVGPNPNAMSFLHATRSAFSSLRNDLPYAIRSLARSPGLTLTIILTFALGVGANAAVFTVLDRVFFAPPTGVREPDRLRRLYPYQVSTDERDIGHNVRMMPQLPTQDMLALRAAVAGRAQIESDYMFRRGHTKPDGERVLVTYVTPGYFGMMGIRMQRGRVFAENEFTVPGAPLPVAVISDRYWKRKYGGDPNVIGKVILMDDDSYTITGVVAPEFEGSELESIDMWSPMSNVEGGNHPSNRVIMRVNEGIETNALDQLLTKTYLELHENDKRVSEGSYIMTAPMQTARGPQLTGTSSPRVPGISENGLALLARLAIVGVMVLVIAVANVASLLLMRAVRRRHEIAICLALGVSNGRLISQLVIESVLLSLLAGGAALYAAFFAGRLLRTQLGQLIHWSDVVVNKRVIVLAMVVAVIGGCCAGLAPALFALRADVASWLRSGTVVRVGSRIRSGLLIAQAALCMALLASAGTLLMSLRRAEFADRGFDVPQTINVTMPAFHATSETDLQRAMQEIRAMPDVESVGQISGTITSVGIQSKIGLSASDTVGPNANGPWLDFADQHFARASGMTLLKGKWFDSTNVMLPVIVLNEAMARALYRGRPIAGTCVRVREPGGGLCREVLGITKNVDGDAQGEPQQRAYIPIMQAWMRPPTGLVPNYFMVRMRSEATPEMVQRVRDAIARVGGPSARDAVVRTVKQQLEPQLQPWRLAVKLFFILGVLGLVAATAGIYGLVSFDVTQRTRELGVRLALGASATNIVSLTMQSALRVLGYGIVAGVLAALVVGRVMSAIMFETSPYDPIVLSGTIVAVALVTIVASLVPAWRATRLSPAVALSTE